MNATLMKAGAMPGREHKGTQKNTKPCHIEILPAITTRPCVLYFLVFLV